MEKEKLVGLNYLHRHTQTEKILNVDSEHVIIDRKDWEEVVEYFHNNPDEIKKLTESKSLENIKPKFNKDICI